MKSKPPSRRRLRPGLTLALLTTLAWSCGGNGDGSPSSVPPWEPSLVVSTDELQTARGLRPARGIIHLHSVYSHDACDGRPQPGGKINEPCLQDLRRGICETKQDYVMLTDHLATMVDQDFEDLFLMRDGDQPVKRGGKIVASLMDCGEGRHAVVMVGTEVDLGPVGLEEHAAESPESRETAYDRTDPAWVESLHNLGAVVWVPHTENKDLEWLRSVPVDAMEVYNLHANIDPDIRKDYLGLSPLGAIFSLIPFLDKSPEGPHPDLALLGFFSENTNAIEKWNDLLRGKRISGVAGSDIHQNVFFFKLRDGERGDGYRRLMHWFSNHVLVSEVTDLTVKEALRVGRSYSAFEVLGVPDGFDFHARSGARTYEMGESVPLGSGLELVVKAPRVHGLGRADERPSLRMVLLGIGTEGAAEVASGSDDLAYAVTKRGAYRAEVRITPNHLKGWLGEMEAALIHEYLWIYSNPIYIE